MPRTEAGVRPDSTARLSQLADRRPEWQTWIRMLGVAWSTIDNGRWDAIGQPRELTGASPGLPGQAPLLHGRKLELDAVSIHDLVRDLASTATLHDGYRPTPVQALELISAAIGYNGQVIRQLAAASGIDSDGLAAVAHLAAFPVLQTCGRLLAEQLPSYWQAGYCPVCAAWPLIAERRGLDRSRRLRCGRCAADWEVPWLFCIYCGERDHQKLGSLEPDAGAERVKVETCASCRGYLKSVASLQGLPPLDLLLQDLETIEFDLVALQREYRRPVQQGFLLDVQLVDRAPR